ncbi:MAG: RNA-binding protein 6, partial [Bradyrhizobium sp.]|nr:RNA-binding protein 6 [Bradyrhizobium sp.]
MTRPPVAKAAKAKAPTLEKIEVRNRWTGAIQFTAEIETTPDMTPRVKLGLAVRWAYKSGADLRGADLRDADLRDADQSDADLRVAVLRVAVLRGADLRGADLRG